MDDDYQMNRREYIANKIWKGSIGDAKIYWFYLADSRLPAKDMFNPDEVKKWVAGWDSADSTSLRVLPESIYPHVVDVIIEQADIIVRNPDKLV